MTFNYLKAKNNETKIGAGVFNIYFVILKRVYDDQNINTFLTDTWHHKTHTHTPAQHKVAPRTNNQKL